MALNNTDLQTLLSEIEKKFERHATKITEDVTRNISATLDTKFETILQENEELKKEVSALKAKIGNMERDTRKNNFVIHGIKETENNPADLMQLILDHLNIVSEKTDINAWDKWEISSVRRLGKPTQNKIRPILITVTLTWRKIEIFKHKKYFPENVYISEDLPKDIIIKRKELKIQQQEEIKKGNLAYIRYDKLIVKEKPVETRKRLPTTSPKTLKHLDGQNISGATKINKTNKMERVHSARTHSVPSMFASKKQ